MRPASPIEKHAKACAQQLQRAAFEGDFRVLDRVLADYRQVHLDEDPHARAVFEALVEQVPGNGLLAWRSTSTNPLEWRQQLRRRWDAWLAILPLDCQLYLVRMEAEPRTLDCIDLGAIKWDQWDALCQATDPAAEKSCAPLWPQDPARQSRDSVDNTLRQVSRDIAGQLAAWKQYEALEDWMCKARIDPCEPVDKLYVYYQGPSMRGSSLAKAQPALPFWAVGLYAGAGEDSYWDVIARLGGPTAPLAGDVDLVAPLARIQPQANLAIEALAQVERTAAQWQQRALEAGTAAVDTKIRTAPRL